MRTRRYGPEPSDDQRWANDHIDAMAAKYPGKIVGVSDAVVVIVATTIEGYREKRAAWYEMKHGEGSSHHSVTSVPRRKIFSP